MASAQTQPFKRYIDARGFKSLNALGQKAQVPFTTLTALDNAALAPNSPFRILVARALGVSAEAIADYCKGPALAPSTVQQIRTRIENRGKRSMALVRQPKAEKVERRNSLKRQGGDLRQAVRSMLMTTNLAVMKGDKYVSNLPTDALYLVLNDYAQQRGIKVPVVLNPKFAELFD